MTGTHIPKQIEDLEMLKYSNNQIYNHKNELEIQKVKCWQETESKITDVKLNTLVIIFGDG